MAGLFLGGAPIALNFFGLGWRSIFLINLPVIPLALFALISLLIDGREAGWPERPIVLLAASLLLLWLFWRHEQKLEAAWREPTLAPSLLRIPGLLGGGTGEHHGSTRDIALVD